MVELIDRSFGEKFLKSIDNFIRTGSTGCSTSGGKPRPLMRSPNMKLPFSITPNMARWRAMHGSRPTSGWRHSIIANPARWATPIANS